MDRKALWASLKKTSRVIGVFFIHFFFYCKCSLLFSFHSGSRDKLLCRRFLFFVLENVCFFFRCRGCGVCVCVLSTFSHLLSSLGDAPITAHFRTCLCLHTSPLIINRSRVKGAAGCSKSPSHHWCSLLPAAGLEGLPARVHDPPGDFWSSVTWQSSGC